MSGEAADAVDYRDLRIEYDPPRLDGFVRLYDEAFTDPSEREDPAEWPARLRSERGPRLHIIVGSRQGVDLGGLALEYFPESACGLYSYVVVDRSSRKRGIAKELFLRGRKALLDEASAAGRTLQAIFAETEDPSLVPPSRSAMPPNDRIAALARLGARWIDLPYVQPEIAPGIGRCPHLILLAFPMHGEAALAGQVVRGFLREFYTSAGECGLNSDPDFQRMVGQIGPRVPLLDLLLKRTDG